MPPSDKPTKEKSVQQVVEDLGMYPPEAYAFVQQGLSFTVQKLHGKVKDPKANRHVTGTHLCEGLRELALNQWGRLAHTVLRRWNITATVDFGRIVFAMVEAGLMQKTEDDTLEDFRNVFDFRTALENEYQIPCNVL